MTGSKPPVSPSLKSGKQILHGQKTRPGGSAGGFHQNTGYTQSMHGQDRVYPYMHIETPGGSFIPAGALSRFPRRCCQPGKALPVPGHVFLPSLFPQAETAV